MLNDLRHTLRCFRRSPGFVLVAVGSLALGIGANTAVFSLFDQVLLRSLPVADPSQLVLFHHEGQDPGWASADNFESVYSYPTYKEFRNRSQVFQGVAARSGASATVMELAGAARAYLNLVSGNFFEVLGTRALLGRTLLPSDETDAAAHPVVVLSHAYWSSRFGSEPKVLNSRLLVNGQPLTVIGVLPRGFLGIQTGQTPDLYAALTLRPRLTPASSALGLAPGRNALDDVSGRWLNVTARLKPGVTREKAQAATRVLFKAIRQEDLPKIHAMSPPARADYERRTIELRPAAQGINMLSDFWRTPLRVLMAMAGLVLLIACANLASLLIARAAARRKEMALRTAVGASRAAILRQLLTESLTLTVSAGALGLLIARWSVVGLLRLFDNEDGPGWVTAQLDWRLFGYSMLIATVAGLVFGCAPLLESFRADLVSALKEQAATTALPARQRLRKVLVASQIALSLVLLAGAALFTRTLMNLRNTNPGFEPAHVLTFAIDPRLSGYEDARSRAILRQVRERLAGMPGVESVVCAAAGPFVGYGIGGSIWIEGYKSAPDEEPGAGRDAVSAGYFRALRIPLLTGREFDERDNAKAPKVAIVNEAFARKYFRGRNPLGLHLGESDTAERQVVGVVRDTQRDSLREKQRPFVYFAHEQEETGQTFLYVRGYGRDLAAEAREALRAVDPNLPLTNVRTMQARIDESMFAERSIAMLAAAFGLLATVLAAVGLYGVVAYSVARRTVEIGVRMALGAARGDVYRIVLKEVGVLVVAGAAVGLPASLALGRVIESQLFGVRSNDPLLLGAAVAALALVALAAAFVPARRAARIDPVRALRSE